MICVLFLSCAMTWHLVRSSNAEILRVAGIQSYIDPSSSLLLIECIGLQLSVGPSDACGWETASSASDWCITCRHWTSTSRAMTCTHWGYRLPYFSTSKNCKTPANNFYNEARARLMPDLYQPMTHICSLPRRITHFLQSLALSDTFPTRYFWSLWDR